ncbi:MAG TPA: endo alpha-1,4 polygalactosaminidase [Solirubrobacterales bacterium]|nr:endo alpha-1,4 polygalactosaminidase [Solirubrobacterales bacterium]
MTGRSLATALATMLVVSLLLAPGVAARWQPKPTTAAWQWQLQGKIDTSIEAGVYEVDGFEVAAVTVARLHRRGRKGICYLDVGSWESYRPDAGRFPKSVIGRAYEGYPDERWLDIRRIDLLAPVLRQRFDLCRRKGFDAVEPDNIAGYENETGFPLGAGDQLRFNRWVARQVHRRGMSVALKNDPGQVRQLVGRFDFAVVEECFAYDECRRFSPFVDAGKAVFVAEYEEPLASICGQAERLRFSVIRKDYDLFARPWEPCFPAGS